MAETGLDQSHMRHATQLLFAAGYAEDIFLDRTLFSADDALLITH